MIKNSGALLRLFQLAIHIVLRLTILLIGLSPLRISAQAQENKGLPFITNYRYQDYNADGVNWWAAEDDNGVMYFANNLGVLVYDGQHWEVVTPIDYTETRSLVKGRDGIIYVGTYGDFGYLEPDKIGKLKFVSLKSKLDAKYHQFGEVWECHLLGDKIIFRTNNYVFELNGEVIKVIESEEDFHVGAVVNNEFYIRIWNRGLTVLKADSFHVVPGGEQFATERIYAMLRFDEQRMLIGTRTKGLFLYDGKQFTPFKTEADPYLVNTSLYGGLILPDGNIALNTFNDGLVIIDKRGRLIQLINKSVGLQDNSVDHLFVDSHGMLWMPLFNGIAKVDLRSSLSFYGESTGLPAKTVFGVGFFKDVLYAGTNNGVFMRNNATNRFQKVKGTSGQIGSFLQNGDDFLVGGAENGLLKIVGDETYPVIPGINYDFHVRELLRSKIDSTVIYATIRGGMAVVRYNPGVSKGSKYSVESIGSNIYSGLVERKDGALWSFDSHKEELNLIFPDRSKGKVDIESPTIRTFNKSHGLPDKPLALYEDEKGNALFISEPDSIFVWDDKTERLVQDTTTLVGKYMTNTSDGTLKFFTDNLNRQWANFGGGVLVRTETSDGKSKIITSPFSELKKNYPVWNILPTVNKSGQPVIWFSGREGIIRYDGNLDESTNGKFNTIIRNITLNEDSVYFSGFALPLTKPSFSKSWNTIRIQFAAPFFKLENETVFSTYLENRDNGWSEWSTQDFREFGNLSHGRYTFRVKAKNIYDVESTEASFSFSVLPPWYATWWAYALYTLLAGATIYTIVRWRTHQLREKHRELEKLVESRTGELKLRAEELAVINSVQEGLVKELDTKAIYVFVGDRICKLFDTQTVIIRTFDRKGTTEQWQYAIEKGERVHSEPRPVIWANQQLLEKGKPILINENYLETAKKYGGTGVSIGLPPKSALFVPMIVGDEVRGSVSLQNIEKEHAFTEADQRLLTTLTNSMSVALENVRLFDESNRLLADAKQRANELGTVNNISQALTSQLNLDDLINLVGEQMKQLFRANIVYLAILDPKTKTINFPYQHGDDMEPINLGEGLTSKIITTGQALLINKDLDELRVQLGVKKIGVPAASYLGVPIPVGDEVIGVLSVQSTEHENRFNEDDLRLLSTIAASVGIALRKAKLFEEVKIARLEAEAARKNAERANEAKSSFLSTVSHELRTPLTSVLGFAKIIKKRLEEKIFPVVGTTDPKTEKVIKQISDNLDVVVSEGERLTHLINDVLDLAKIEAGKMEWNMETISMTEIAERAIAATTSLFEHNGLALEKNIQGDIPDISGDGDKLIQVIVNLISNAVKFTPQGKVTCSVYRKADEVVVSITDTGIGIAPKDHAAVFEQFKQVGDTLTDKPKGTGLGLPICLEIVEHHGGRIWLESELGKGSAFLFALPVPKSIEPRPMHLTDLVRQLKAQVASAHVNAKDKAARLLIVDDDDSIRSLLHQELAEAGYYIEEARNGKEALVRARANRPDLIILDIMMPEMNGFDVAAVLKNDPQTMDIPIIVLSVVQDKTRGYRIGVDRYLTKPIDTALLFNEIGNLLGQGKSHKKVMVVDEDTATVNTLTEVLKAKGYTVLESDGKALVETAIDNQPDIIVINSALSGKHDIVKTLRFEKGLENVLFFVYE
jgi:signal transduction histidine kinase/DNA-binding response OmpR family regulator